MKNKLSIKATIFKVALFVFVCSLLWSYSYSENDNNDYELNKVAFLYDGADLVGVNTAGSADDLIDTQKQQAKKVIGTKNDSNVSTNVIPTPSLVSFDITEQEQEETIDYVKQNTRLLEDGYTLTIDNKYKYYFTDLKTIDWVGHQILLAYFPDKSYVDYYDSTGEFKAYTEGDKKFTGISLDNKITITEGSQPGSELIDTKEELIFDLFHKNQNKVYEIISDDTSIASIKKDNDLSDTTFKLDNPNLEDNSVTYNGQQIITNQLDPVLNVVQTYETVETEEVEFETVQEIDDSMLQGQFEITTEGEDGEKEITYENQLVNGQEVSSEKVGEVVTKKPVQRVVTMGEGTMVNSVTVESGGVDSSLLNVTSSGFIWPSASQSVTCEYMGYSGHTGIDIQNYYGAPEYAAKDGIVVTSGWSNYGYGYHVVIDHGNGVKTLYGHQNQQPPVQVGQYVQQGQVIGYEGSTGNVTGEHLHFEVQINGTAVNPRPYITSEPAYNMGSVCS